MNAKAEQAIKDFLTAMGLDLTARHMEQTPARVVELYEYLLGGRPERIPALWGRPFPTDSRGLIAIRHIPFYSLCEHHLVPFFGEVYIAYLPHNGMAAGFSKFARVIGELARQPQLQERLTQEIAEAIGQGIAAEGVLVIVEARQLCMMLRSEIAPDTTTLTTASSGRLQTDASLRQEAWSLLMKGENKHAPSA